MSHISSDIGSYLQAPLKAFHHEVGTLFDPLASSNKVCEVAKRIFIILVLPFAYILLSIPYLLAIPFLISSKTWNHHLAQFSERHYGVHPFAKGQELAQQIEALPHGNLFERQKMAVNLVRAARFDQSEFEIQRLQGAHVLTVQKMAKLDAALQSVVIESASARDSLNRPRMKALLGQAIELKKIYKDTHNVFIHAQASSMMVFTYLIKALAKKTFPHLDLHHFKYLRAPCSTAEKGTVEKVMNFASALLWGAPKENDARKYSTRWVVSDNDMKVREELISVDAYFFSTARFESAIHFLSNNFNILPAHSVMAKIARIAIQHFYPNLVADKVQQFANQLLSIPTTQMGCGNLFVICTPKETVDRFHYRSHPFALPCNCHSELDKSLVLETLQDDVSNPVTSCLPGHNPIPQFRLFAPLLNPALDFTQSERKYRSYLLTPYPKAYRQSIKHAVCSIVDSIHQYSLTT